MRFFLAVVSSSPGAGRLFRLGVVGGLNALAAPGASSGTSVAGAGGGEHSDKEASSAYQVHTARIYQNLNISNLPIKAFGLLAPRDA